MAAKTPAKGKKATQKQYLMYGGAAIAVAIGYYLYKQHSANSAASSTSSGIDPATGVPYSQETGANAIDPNTGIPYAAELGSSGYGGLYGSSGTSSANPFTAVDPATGMTYASEAGLGSGSGGGVDPATGQSYASELAAAQAAQTQAQTDLTGFEGTVGQYLGGGAGAGVNPGGPNLPPTGTNPGSSTPGHASRTLSQWTASAEHQLTTLHGVSPTEARQAVTQFLKGEPITSATAAKGLHNIAKTSGNLGAPPVRNGAHLPIVVARTVSHQTPAPAPRPATVHATQPVLHTVQSLPVVHQVAQRPVATAKPQKPLFPYRPGFGVTAPKKPAPAQKKRVQSPRTPSSTASNPFARFWNTFFPHSYYGVPGWGPGTGRH